MRRLIPALIAFALVAVSCSDSSETSASAPATTESTAASNTTPSPEPTTTEQAPSSTSTSTSTTAAPTTTAAPEGWVKRLPGDDCKCASGTEYNYWTRNASQTKVVLYLQGGGACFSAKTCSFTDGTYSVYADRKGSPADMRGIFDFDNPLNPFSDWSFVYMPYCTGDVHVGNSVQEYAPDLVVNHNGYVNVTKGLDYLVSHYPDAEEVFVTGSSAGGVAAPFFSGLVSDALPNARITVLADGAGSYPDIPEVNTQLADLWGSMSVLPDWPVNAGMTAAEWSLPGFYVQSGLHDPDIRMARFDYARDKVQARFTDAAGVGSNDRLGRLNQNEVDIEAAGVDLRVYVAPGDQHTILMAPGLYSLTVEGVPFIEWLTTLVEGGEVADVRCVDCGP